MTANSACRKRTAAAEYPAMGAHHHHHDHHHLNASDSTKNIALVLALNATFTVVELIGGYLTGSVAIMADALHDLGDCVSLISALVLEKLAGKSHDHRFSYGYRRLSLLSALITSVVLVVGTIFILFHSVPRLFNPVQPHVEGMFALAVIGVAVNGFAAWKIMGGATMNERTISWHMIEDVLAWLAVLIGSVVMYFWNFPIIDPILSIGFSAVILVGVSRNFVSTVLLFLQGVPKDLDLQQVRQQILDVHDVTGLHDLHLWSLDGARHVMSMHAVVADHVSMKRSLEIKQQIRQVVAKHGTIHLTLEIETASEDCPDMDCGQN